MHVTLHDAKTLALTFAYSPATVERVKALGATWDKERKEWHAPLYLLRRILDTFHGAQIEQDCIEARRAQWRRWVQQHNAWGIWFALDADGKTVVPTSTDGELSPVFVEHVAAHSAIIEQFLGDQVQPVVAEPAQVRTVEPTAGDKLIWAGLQNAAKAEEERAETVERAKVRARQAKQMSLLEDA